VGKALERQAGGLFLAHVDAREVNAQDGVSSATRARTGALYPARNAPAQKLITTV